MMYCRYIESEVQRFKRRPFNPSSVIPVSLHTRIIDWLIFCHMIIFRFYVHSFYVSLWWRGYAWNIRLCFLYRQYTKFLYFDLYLNTAYAAHYVYSEFKIWLSYFSVDEEGIHKPTFWDLLPFVLYRLTVSTIKKAQQRRQFLKEEKIRLKLIEEEEEMERERAKEAGKRRY